jgi:hypothetical protein
MAKAEKEGRAVKAHALASGLTRRRSQTCERGEFYECVA